MQTRLIPSSVRLILGPWSAEAPSCPDFAASVPAWLSVPDPAFSASALPSVPDPAFPASAAAEAAVPPAAEGSGAAGSCACPDFQAPSAAPAVKTGGIWSLSQARRSLSWNWVPLTSGSILHWPASSS